MCIVKFLLIYIIGYCISVILLRKFPSFFGLHYDNNEDYDDWRSNAEAAVGISFAWPLYFFAKLIRISFNFLIKSAKKIKEYKSKNKEYV